MKINKLILSLIVIVAISVMGTAIADLQFITQEQVLEVRRAAEIEKKAQQKKLMHWGGEIVRHVQKYWHQSFDKDGLTAVVELQLSSAGYIRNLQFLQCRDQGFCASIEDAFRRAEPLPSPPHNVFERTLTITMDN